jgi:hypothetical protein
VIGRWPYTVAGVMPVGFANLLEPAVQSLRNGCERGSRATRAIHLGRT